MTFEATRRDILRAGGLAVGGALLSGAIATRRQSWPSLPPAAA